MLTGEPPGPAPLGGNAPVDHRLMEAAVRDATNSGKVNQGTRDLI
jgi:hypothetical protein